MSLWIIALFFIFKPSKPLTPEEIYEKKIQNIRSSCRAAIVTRLKSPNSANFTDAGIVNVNSLGNNIYTVIRTLEATNSFNAVIRSKFMCKIKLNEDNTTSLILIKELHWQSKNNAKPKTKTGKFL